ncbi:MAG TPA: terminase small subunit [Acidobacteriaceae bacterium]|jgi:phage terminase Nu1 subunit (DNA packaging protein)
MDEGQKFGGLNALPVEDVAELLSVSPKTIRNWLNKEDLPCQSDGRRRVLDWTTTLEWYVQRRIQESGKHGNEPEAGYLVGEETLEQAETRKTIAEADLKELKLAELRGQMVPADEVGRNVGQVASAIKTKLDAMPNALALRLVGKKDRVEVQKILHDEIYRLQLELANVGKQYEPKRIVTDEDEE